MSDSEREQQARHAADPAVAYRGQQSGFEDGSLSGPLFLPAREEPPAHFGFDLGVGLNSPDGQVAEAEGVHRAGGGAGEDFQIRVAVGHHLVEVGAESIE